MRGSRRKPYGACTSWLSRGGSLSGESGWSPAALEPGGVQPWARLAFLLQDTAQAVRAKLHTVFRAHAVVLVGISSLN